MTGAPARVKLTAWWREAEMAVASLNPAFPRELTRHSIKVLGPFLLGPTAWELVSKKDGVSLATWDMFRREVELEFGLSQKH